MALCEYARIVILRMGILLYSTPASAIIINHLTAMRTDYREDLEPVPTLLIPLGCSVWRILVADLCGPTVVTIPGAPDGT